MSVFIKNYEDHFLRNSYYTLKYNKSHLSMIYPNGRQALKDISLTLESPSLIGLAGPNGAGKSTLMKLLVAGLLPTGGTISVDDAPLSRCEKKLKEKLGYLPQDFGLYDELTVREFLDYMAALKGIRDSKAAIESAILATGLEEKRKARIKTLSGGQRQCGNCTGAAGHAGVSYFR